ncbi:cytochrome P450 [Laetiporus sulphureus 93-53]|uniref:Cytochrome P450 n=1 Tax=Laetiporus sulphureus 93-53 TaxID=1314785 RepID=A0A165D5X7_9APHY|nr:cytochrome P450 [Laetiporus sulphureus 93-53]KZT04209.1 cytochrome P450 [Laetiporus sulphureus 93-53]
MVTVIDRWANEYGPLVHIRLFGKSVIIISSSEVAKDLLESRHKNYSGRPNFIMASKAMQDDMMMPFIHANDRFFRARKLVTTELRLATAEVHRLCMLDEPKQWVSFVERAVASILMTAVYDKPLKSNESAEDAVKDVIKLNNDLINVIDGGQNYVDFLPWLRYIPGVPYKVVAASYYDLAERTYRSLMDEAKRNFEGGKPAASIAARLLQSQSEVEADYREQYWALGSFYLAGSDTQSIATQSFIMALALNPDVLARAQAEVDNVVGNDCCPTYDDEDKLPYIRAMVREVLRWRPTGPTAIPHASIQDDEYKGYFIPGGSMVIPNIWSMQMDPKVFEQPETYNPQRYLDDPNLPFHAFGFGDRVCPGRRVAETTLFLTFATIVWAVDVRPAISPETGKPIPINSDRETGFAPVGLLRALPFEVSLTSRFPARTQLLARITENDDL